MLEKLSDLKEQVIDSRDLIIAMEELKEIIDEHEDKYMVADANQALAEFEEFITPFKDYGKWEDGATLISESYWIDYVKELCIDCEYISDDFPSWI